MFGFDSTSSFVNPLTSSFGTAVLLCRVVGIALDKRVLALLVFEAMRMIILLDWANEGML